MVCPKCNLSYPETVLRCGCGYDFNLRRVIRPNNRDHDLHKLEDSSREESRPVPIIFWIACVGGVGFAAGFFGPIVFRPEANQGPLVGIFFSGPGSACLGLLLCVGSRLLEIPVSTQWWTLLTACAFVGLMTLYVILPEPISRGYLIDAQVQGCETAAGAADAAIQTWEQRLATTTWPNLAPNWRNKARQMLQTDRALVLDMIVLRRNAIVEGRKPWNKGRMIALGWQASNEQQSYYARLTSGSCADYGAGARSVYFSAPPGYHPSAYMLDRPNWPSGNLPEFVHRELLEPVPEKYRELVGAAKP